MAFEGHNNDAPEQTVGERTGLKELIKKLESKTADLERELALKDAIISGHELHARHVEQRLNSVYRSFSWRITEPLRTISTLIGKYSGISVHATQDESTGSGEGCYREWVRMFDTLSDDDRSSILAYCDRLQHNPLISILMPVYNPPQQWLRRAIDSALAQIYPHWELCIADDASTAPYVRPLLEEYQRQDERIKVVYRPENGHISAASNSALALVTGEFIALLDHDDELAEHALFMFAAELNRFPDADILYSDEDKIDGDGNRFEPFFKPDWSPDMLHSQNYVSHLGVYRTSLVKKGGGFREGYEGSQDYDLCLRCSALSRAERIRHLPFVLYHWRTAEGSTAVSAEGKSYAEGAALRALKDHLTRLDPAISVMVGDWPTTYRVTYPLPKGLPLASLIIPTRDGYNVLHKCIESILKKTDYPNFELLIVDNQSTERKTLRYLKQLRRDPRVRVLPYDAPFNYSAINNFAISQARGEIVGLVNNDLEVISPGWLTEMVSQAIRPEIGAVGAKLYYPDDRIQHAGVVLGIRGVAGHAHHTFARREPGYCCRLLLVQNYCAVTAACLVIRKAVYEQVGGLDEEHLKVAFNDVDFCLRVQEAGYRNLWTPYAELYHHESYSRGYENTPEKQARFSGEITYMQHRWGGLLYQDPYYNPNLTLDYSDFSLAWPPRVTKPWLATGRA